MTKLTPFYPPYYNLIIIIILFLYNCNEKEYTLNSNNKEKDKPFEKIDEINQVIDKLYNKNQGSKNIKKKYLEELELKSQNLFLNNKKLFLKIQNEYLFKNQHKKIFDHTIVYQALSLVYETSPTSSIIDKRRNYMEKYGYIMINNYENKRRKINKTNFIGFLYEMLELFKKNKHLDTFQLFINTQKGNHTFFFLNQKEIIYIDEIFKMFYESKELNNRKFIIFQNFQDYIKTNTSNPYPNTQKPKTWLHISGKFKFFDCFIDNEIKKLFEIKNILDQQNCKYKWESKNIDNLIYFKNKDKIIEYLKSKIFHVNKNYEYLKNKHDKFLKIFKDLKNQNEVLRHSNIYLQKEVEKLQLYLKKFSMEYYLGQFTDKNVKNLEENNRKLNPNSVICYSNYNNNSYINTNNSYCYSHKTTKGANYITKFIPEYNNTNNKLISPTELRKNILEIIENLKCKFEILNSSQKYNLVVKDPTDKIFCHDNRLRKLLYVYLKDNLPMKFWNLFEKLEIDKKKQKFDFLEKIIQSIYDNTKICKTENYQFKIFKFMSNNYIFCVIFTKKQRYKTSELIWKDLLRFRTKTKLYDQLNKGNYKEIKDYINLKIKDHEDYFKYVCIKSYVNTFDLDIPFQYNVSNKFENKNLNKEIIKSKLCSLRNIKGIWFCGDIKNKYFYILVSDNLSPNINFILKIKLENNIYKIYWHLSCNEITDRLHFFLDKILSSTVFYLLVTNSLKEKNEIFYQQIKIIKKNKILKSLNSDIKLKWLALE